MTGDRPRRSGGWKYRDEYTPDIGWSGRLFLLVIVMIVFILGFGWLFV